MRLANGLWIVLLLGLGLAASCGPLQISQNNIDPSLFGTCTQDCLPVIEGKRGDQSHKTRYFIEVRGESQDPDNPAITHIAIYARIVGLSKDRQSAIVDQEHHFSYHEGTDLFLGSTYAWDFDLGREVPLDRLSKAISSSEL